MAKRVNVILNLVNILSFRALERWGSMEALERELERRKETMEAGERYRKGLLNYLLF